MMKIFWITPECPYPPNSGGRVGIWKRIYYMGKKNSIFLYSIYDEREELQYKSTLKKYCSDVKMYPRQINIKTMLRSIMTPYPACSRWSKDLREDIYRDYNKIKPDLIIVDFPQMMGILPKSILGTANVVLNQHNIEFLALNSLADTLPLFKKIIYKMVSIQMQLYERRLYESDLIKLYTFVSIKDEEFFRKKFKKRNTLLVPVGAEINDSPVLLEKSHSMLFVAKLSYPANAYGAEWIIKEIFPIIKERVPDVKLYIVGKDPTPEIYESAKKDENIIITGTVESLKEYYDKCNLVVVPVKTGGGVNVKLLEALGEGKIVATTSKGIEGTLFENKKHVIVADEKEEFANACIDVLLNPQASEEMICNTRKIMEEKYSWESIVNTFESNLRDLL